MNELLRFSHLSISPYDGPYHHFNKYDLKQVKKKMCLTLIRIKNIKHRVQMYNPIYSWNVEENPCTTKLDICVMAVRHPIDIHV